MSILEKIVDWFLNIHSYWFFEGSGFALVLTIFVVGALITLGLSKKFRKYFCKKFF